MSLYRSGLQTPMRVTIGEEMTVVKQVLVSVIAGVITAIILVIIL